MPNQYQLVGETLNILINQYQYQCKYAGKIPLSKFPDTNIKIKINIALCHMIRQSGPLLATVPTRL